MDSSEIEISEIENKITNNYRFRINPETCPSDFLDTLYGKEI